MKLMYVLISALSLLTITACKTIDIKDGRIPSKYLSQAKKIEGSYKGEFNGIAGNLVISFNGDKPIVEYHNRHGDDLLNNNCHSSFGDLLKVTVKNENKKPSLSNAIFSFDTGECSLMIYGRDISLDFKQTDHGMKVNLTLLQEIRQHQVCSWNPGPPSNSPNCTWQQDPYYLYGHFIR